MTLEVKPRRFVREDNVEEDLLCLEDKKISQTSQICAEDLPRDQENSLRLNLSHTKGVGGARKKTKTEVMLGNTAKKLNLKKISSLFEPVRVGESKSARNITTGGNFVQTSVVGVSWEGEKCTVQQTNTNCDSQSEKLAQEGPKRHLDFESCLDCDWAGGTEKEFERDEVIGCGLGVVEISANQGDALEN